MSSFVVSDKHLNLVVAAIIIARVDPPINQEFLPQLRYCDKSGDYLFNASHDPEHFGRSLRVMNLKAYDCRLIAEAIERAESEIEAEALAGYSYKDLRAEVYSMSLTEIHKLFFCYLYQCMEGDVMKSPLFTHLYFYYLEIANYILHESAAWKTAKYHYA